MAKHTAEQIVWESWRRGYLGYKLHKHQQPIYDAVWKIISGDNPSLKFVINCARRFGKTFVMTLIAVEFAIRYPNTQIRYAAPIKNDIMNIVVPTLKIIMGDCPEQFKASIDRYGANVEFPNGSVIQFGGTDSGNADNLRGYTSHLNILDEAGQMMQLKYVIDDILMPQTLTTGGKTIVASTPSVTPAHDYYELYTECALDGNMIEFDVWANTSIDKARLEQYMEEAGGEHSTTWKREYLCQFAVDSELRIIPEFNNDYVSEYNYDEYWKYYDKYCSMDLGTVDFTAALFAVYDFQLATLHVLDEFVMNGPEMTTDIIAKAVSDMEDTLWKGMKVRKRISDNNNPLLVNDLRRLHNLSFLETDKGKLSAMVNKVKMWVKSGRIRVNPKCVQLIGCLKYGIWDRLTEDNRKFARHKSYGHFDALAALVYLVRNCDTMSNPVPLLHNVHISTHVIPPNFGNERTGQTAVVSPTAQNIKNAMRPRMTRR